MVSEALANVASTPAPGGGDPGDRDRTEQWSKSPTTAWAGSIDSGSGLRGLADRVEALGGRLQVTSPPGSGTVVRAVMPLRNASTAG